MPRKKKPPSEEDKQKGIWQDAQNPISSDELEAIVHAVRKQYGSSLEAHKSQTESSTPSGSSIQKPQTKSESSTQSGSSTQPIQTRASSKKTLESYAQSFAQKALPEKTFAQQLALPPIPSKVLTKTQYDLLNQQPKVLQINPSQQIVSASIP